MLSYLFLENSHVSHGNSLLFDSAMLLVKEWASGLNIHFNAIRKPNHMFAWFVIDFSSKLLRFDTLVDNLYLMSPAPYTCKDLSFEEQGKLDHNQKILIKFCMSICPNIVQKYFTNVKTYHIGLGCVNLDSLGQHPPSFYVSSMLVLCLCLSCTRQPIQMPKKNNLCGFIILPSYICCIRASVFTSMITPRWSFSMKITISFWGNLFLMNWRIMLVCMDTHPIIVICGLVKVVTLDRVVCSGIFSFRV